VPSAKHLEGKEINKAYYQQTLIEHAWRIRLKIKALGESLGKDKIIGQAAHLNTDLVEDHTQDMWNILSLLVESDDDIQDLKRYFSEIQELLKLFFVELHNKTINA
ncbi:hypothetical protein CJ207_27870, partial [Klebsiella aerogenes]